jgi:hypothetical protein
MTLYAYVSGLEVLEYPADHGTLRVLHPQTSLPDPLPAAVAKELGLFEVEEVPAPVADPATERVIEKTPQWTSGQLQQCWEVVKLSAQEQSERQFEQEVLIRQERNQCLSSCDWTQLPDVAVDKQAWADYRQALRAIPNQAGFPWEVKWPNPPSVANDPATPDVDEAWVTTA